MHVVSDKKITAVHSRTEIIFEDVHMEYQIQFNHKYQLIRIILRDIAANAPIS